jgi:hypothetical protein
MHGPQPSTRGTIYNLNPRQAHGSYHFTRELAGKAPLYAVSVVPPAESSSAP